MAKGFNKVILMGNLTRDPETRQTPNGQSVTNFALAVNRTWKGQDGSTQEQVSFIDCVAWGKTGEVIAQYIQKGRPILVSGRLDQRSWEQDGQKRSKVEVVVEDFNFVGGGDGGGGSFSSSSASSSSSSSSSAKNDDVVVEEIDDKPIDLSEIPF
ncbi:single-stranded DNA-binding protein [Candidatus Nomurabacteria bacterium]|jgi:single-strand DNA-binding protein|nr:single-stranded DNA-binding protein [Candidatus Saccharibacteria bacterium]MCA9313020.1 single-stranded DNA-binding protein [Candidatus Saccharibacteria bacterium]MCB9822174.1 single-stranded DNA-binding protein [Candidatus Nomurabacteria bacterium]MDQ5969530.1 single-strand DNA-binding protein [Patescibacteria group bacterium]